MSRNFALLQIVGKEEEYFQPAGGPELVDAPLLPLEPKTFPPDSNHQQLPDQPHRYQEALQFEMEPWQLEELTKLVHGVFLEPRAESDRAVSNRAEANRAEAKRTVVLASSESGNGCSWICARAGELLASQVAGRVCLVDANFGRPTLHEHFGVPNLHGLSDALRQEGSIGGYVSQVSRRNLALVSSGSDISADRPDRNLAASERLRQRLQELRADFDYVLVDGASLDVGDESIDLAKMTDGIVLVLKTHSTRRERTRSRMQDLKSAGVRILGAVLNQPAS
ncbi:MAG: CpsD/CapB family tyrosine-protein kinase [Candidatus Sulfotelmatobacter sp.]|jgi:Mrp family chromosome partitioning ATPase